MIKQRENWNSREERWPVWCRWWGGTSWGSWRGAITCQRPWNTCSIRLAASLDRWRQHCCSRHRPYPRSVILSAACDQVPGKERGTNGRRRPGSLEAEQHGNLLLHVMTMGARASGARTSPREMGAKAGSSERDQDRDGRPRITWILRSDRGKKGL
jgi:hypothetical protein